MKKENYPWTLGKPRITTTKIGSLDTSTTLSMDILQRIVESQRKKR